MDATQTPKTPPAITVWRIPLVGHAFDLEDWPHWLADRSIQVARQEDKYMLCVPATLGAVTAREARAVADQHLDLLNGIGSLLAPGYRPVALGDTMFAEHTDGTGRTVVTLVTATVIGRIKGQVLRGSVSGVPLPDKRVAAADPFLRAAAISRRAHDALVLLGRPGLTWSELYVLFEIVQADVGGQMYERGWMAKGEADRFTTTACSYEVLGIESRHGRSTGVPPKHPMTHEHATRLIRKLLAAWLWDTAARSAAPSSSP